MVTISKEQLLRIAGYIFTCLLTLFGCHKGPQTTVVTMSSIDNTGSSATRATISDGLARFQCVESAQGRCNFVLFLSQCTAYDPQSRKKKGACTTKLIESFAVAEGADKEIRDLPKDFRFCVGYAGMPVVPGCAR